MSNKKCFSPFSFFFFESYDKLRTKKNNMSVGESAKSSANSLLNMIKNDVGNKGLIAGIIKYAFLLLILVKIPVYMVGSDEYNYYLDKYIFNIIFPTFQLLFFIFTAYKFKNFYSIENKETDSYKKFKTLIFWVSVLSIVQLVFNFVQFWGISKKKEESKIALKDLTDSDKKTDTEKLKSCELFKNKIKDIYKIEI